MCVIQKLKCSKDNLFKKIFEEKTKDCIVKWSSHLHLFIRRVIDYAVIYFKKILWDTLYIDYYCFSGSAFSLAAVKHFPPN